MCVCVCVCVCVMGRGGTIALLDSCWPLQSDPKLVSRLTWV